MKILQANAKNYAKHMAKKNLNKQMQKNYAKHMVRKNTLFFLTIPFFTSPTIK